jgi:hypothetical protein
MYKYAKVDTDTNEVLEMMTKHPRLDKGEQLIGWPDNLRIFPVVYGDRPSSDGFNKTVQLNPVIDVNKKEVYIGFGTESVDIALKKDLIKSKAGEIILEHLPEWKQRNLIAGSLVKLANFGQKDATTLQLWAWVNSVRSHSNLLEAALDNGESVDLEQGTSETVVSGWPVFPVI